jgi:hypothetical protein
MTAAQPRRTPMGAAAGSPIGPSSTSRATKTRDTLIVVVAPFLVPGVILAFARTNVHHGIFASFTLGDIAFGFVAVAIAGTARAATLKSDEWQAFAIGATIMVALQTALAIAVDTVNESNSLRNTVQHASSTTIERQLPHLQDLAAAIGGNDPGPVQWTISLATGFALMIVSFELIRRERSLQIRIARGHPGKSTVFWRRSLLLLHRSSRSSLVSTIAS